MTMTEPSSQSADCKSDTEHLNESDSIQLGSQTSGQEVNKVASPSGGGSQSHENGDGDFFDRDASQCSGSEIIIHRERRGVTFPDGMVSGYLEPHDPWKNAPGWTAEDLVYAYKKSCEKHGTKPLNKILQQIQSLVNNGKRQETFSLKGEKLEHKHCESVEEILRRVQFKQIDLEACHLDDESSVALFDMIEYYDSACSINISFNKNIGLRGWQACSRLIRKTPHLTFLDVRNCELNERSIPIIGRALKMGSPLTVLHLENTYLSGRALIILVAALKMNETLEELFLADNKLMPSDGIQLGTLLKYNHKLELLDLRNNHLQDVGTSHLCDGLLEQNLDTGLKTLVLWNNGITYQAMSSVSRALLVTECLETLNIGRNNVTNEGAHQLKDGLLKSKALLRLGLQGTKISCEGAVALAEFVADSPRLLRLDLRENDIRTAGLMALSLAMRVNETVTRLDLDKDTKKESGMKDYADQQRRLQQEIIRYQECNQRKTLEREEEEHRALEEQAREEAARKSVEEALRAAQETIQTDLDISYIPSAEKIQRPKLLFFHVLTPQQTLESPDTFTKDDIPTSSASTSSATLHVKPPPGISDTYLTTPPSELLLSPQYSPRLTARKIFSVSKVGDSSPSPTLVAGQPGESGHPLNVLASSHVPGGQKVVSISPTTLCHDLATETVNEYIDQIVSEAIDIHEQCEDGESVDSEKGPADVEHDRDETSSKPGEVTVVGTSPAEQVESDNCAHKMDTVESTSQSNASVESNTGQSDVQNGVAVDPNSQDGTTVELSDNNKLRKSVQNITKSGEVRSEESIAINTNADTESSKIPESVLYPVSQKPVSEVGNKCPDLMGPGNIQNSTNANCPKPDSGLGSYENDQWVSVNSSELNRQWESSVSCSGEIEVEKPDFHTNLSLNGLARELASALDTFDEPIEKSAMDVPKPGGDEDKDETNGSTS